jgi:hypothetical protein
MRVPELPLQLALASGQQSARKMLDGNISQDNDWLDPLSDLISADSLHQRMVVRIKLCNKPDFHHNTNPLEQTDRSPRPPTLNLQVKSSTACQLP